MAEQIEVTALEFKEWTQNKITKKVVSDIINMQEHLKHYVATGQTLSEGAEFTTDRIVGRIEGIMELFNLFQDTQEDLKESPDYEH